MKKCIVFLMIILTVSMPVFGKTDINQIVENCSTYRRIKESKEICQNLKQNNILEYFRFDSKFESIVNFCEQYVLSYNLENPRYSLCAKLIQMDINGIRVQDYLKWELTRKF